MLDRIRSLRARSQPFEQKSSEWFKLRGRRLGGSEMHTVLYGTANQHETLMQKKEGILESSDEDDWMEGSSPVALEWGTLMEEVTAYILRTRRGYRDLDVSCVLDAECEHLLFSPDMIAEKDGELVVVEIKSPFTRVPDGHAPFHYRAQLNTGLAVVQEADCCVFVDVAYRVCSMEQLMGPHCGFNRTFHTQGGVSDKVLAGGFLVLVAPKEDALLCSQVVDAGSDATLARQTLSFSLEEIKVLWSESDGEEFCKRRVISEIMRVLVYGDMRMRNEDVLVRILPWKMYAWEETRHERDPRWSKKIRQYARNFFRTYSTRVR